jgi:hypothetical protein
MGGLGYAASIPANRCRLGTAPSKAGQSGVHLGVWKKTGMRREGDYDVIYRKHVPRKELPPIFPSSKEHERKAAGTAREFARTRLKAQNSRLKLASGRAGQRAGRPRMANGQVPYGGDADAHWTAAGSKQPVRALESSSCCICGALIR